MKKSANKILGFAAALICAGMGVITGLSVYDSVKFSTLSKKIENLAAEKNISLEEKNCLHSRYQGNDFISKDVLSENIRSELFNKRWILDSRDSIECNAPVIICKGNVEGTYTLNGVEEREACYSWYSNEKYSHLKINENGTREREYTPKTGEELEQVRLTVLDVIDSVLEKKNLKAEYTDIQVTIASEPDFDKFILADYRFYKNGCDVNKNNALYYSLILCFYIVCMISYFISNETKKSLAAKKFLAVVALAGLCVFVKFDFNKVFPLFLQFLAIVVLLHWALKILTRNNFSRRAFFNFLGTITAFLWLFVPFARNGYFFRWFNEGQTNITVMIFLLVSSVITFCMLAQSWRVILDERPSESHLSDKSSDRKEKINQNEKNRNVKTAEASEIITEKPFRIEIGYSLFPLVAETDSPLLKGICDIRNEIKAEHGKLFPSVSIVDNINLNPAEFRILFHGTEVCRESISDLTDSDAAANQITEKLKRAVVENPRC